MEKGKIDVENGHALRKHQIKKVKAPKKTRKKGRVIALQIQDGGQTTWREHH